MATNGTEKEGVWPSGAPQGVRDVVTLFFSLADDRREGVGERLAKEVFTSDGVFAGTVGKFQGSAGEESMRLAPTPTLTQTNIELARCRDNAWTKVATRHHEIQRVYVNDAQGLEIIVIGTMTASTHEGTKSNHGFMARAVLSDIKSQPKISMYRVLASGGDNYLE